MGKYGRLAAGAFSVGMLIAASESSAQSLQGLGYPSDGGPGSGPGPSPKVSGVSADGRVVVGQFNDNGTARAFRWTDDTGMVRIAPLQWGAANAVNSDGRIIVGVADDGGKAEAFRWVDDGTPTGALVGLGFLSSEPGYQQSEALAVSATGATVVGSSWNGSNYEAFRWTESSDMTGLGFLPGGNSSAALGISSDATVVVGFSSDGNYNVPVRWIENGTSTGLILSLGTLSPGGNGSATAVNRDGTVIVGGSWNGSTSEAFRWVDDGSPSGLMQGLGYLSPGGGSGALAVNGDGTVIVGRAFDSSLEDTAFIWTPETEMVSLVDMLADAGVDVAGWQLQWATGVSADGKTIVGSGGNGSPGSELWIARLGPTPGVTTREAALNSLLTLGQVPNVASNFVLNLLATNSEYARQHSTDASAPPVQPLAYGEEGDSGVAAMVPPRSLRVFGYGLGGAAFDPDGTSGAALIGASVAVTDHLVVGGSVGYGAVRSDMDMGGEATIRGPSATMFIASTPETGLQFLAAGSVAGFDADIRRGYMNGAGEASSSGETDGAGYGGLVRAGYAFALDDRNRLEPFAQYEAVHSRLDAYSEKGGPFPAEISKMSQTDQIGRLGAELRHRFRPDAWVWGSAAWAHRFDDSGVDLAIQFIDLFGVSGSAPVGASDWMEAAVGISLPVGHDVRLTGSVTAGLFGEGSDTLLGRVGVSSAF